MSFDLFALPVLNELYNSLMEPGKSLEIAIPVATDHNSGYVFESNRTWLHAPAIVTGLYLVVTESTARLDGNTLLNACGQIYSFLRPKNPTPGVRCIQSLSIRVTTGPCVVDNGAGGTVCFGRQLLYFQCKASTDGDLGSIGASTDEANNDVGHTPLVRFSHEINATITHDNQSIATVFLQQIYNFLNALEVR